MDALLRTTSGKEDILHLSRQQRGGGGREAGFVLILAVVVLLVLSLLGIWALRTSMFELDVAGSSQQIESQLNLAEGAANAEAGNVAILAKQYYQIADPDNMELLLVPVTKDDFNPGRYMGSTLGAINAADCVTWPWDNLLRNYDGSSAANQLTYRYLTTYVKSTAPPMGNNAGSLNGFAGYEFRIQGTPASTSVVIEVGANKIGVQ